MLEIAKKFVDILTDDQLIIFCLHYGFNERGITLTLTELSNLTGKKISTVSQTLDTINYKISMSSFSELVNKMAEYE